MKAYISLLLGFTVSILNAQSSPEVIYCNEYQNVAIVMDAPISQAVTGSENFIFSYNRTEADSLGLLQGRAGQDSNLVIRTSDGGLYNYILRHKDSLDSFVHFIKPEDRVNHMMKEKATSQVNRELSQSVVAVNTDRYFDKLCNYYLKRNSQELAAVRKHKIKLTVEGMYYYKNNVFVVMEIINRSKIDFKIEDLSLAKLHGVKSRKSSYQKLILKEHYRKGFPELVPIGSKAHFVMVYPKFALGRHEKLLLALSESSGSRYLNLEFE